MKIKWIIKSVLFLGLSLNLGPSYAENTKSLKFGVMSLAQPSRILKQWQPFVEYLEKKTGQKIEIVIPRGFKKIKKAIAENKVDIFYTNSHVFYRLLKEGKSAPLAQMQNLDGSIMSRSSIFVRSDSDINSIEDLKGKNFSFVSPMGAGGYLAPRALLEKNGIRTKVDLSEKFTKNLSNSIHHVLLKNSHAGTMCGLNYKLMSKKINTGELKIIANSDDYPENILGARPQVPEELRQLLIKTITGMAKDEQGTKVLAMMRGMKIKQFVAYDRIVEDVLQKLMKEAGMANGV